MTISGMSTLIQPFRHQNICSRVHQIYFFLKYGREARLPLEAEKFNAIDDPTQLADVQEGIDCLNKLREKIFPLAKKNVDDSQTTRKEQYCRRKGLEKKNIRALKHTETYQKEGHKMEDTSSHSFLAPQDLP